MKNMIGKVLETDEYHIFKRLQGNRTVSKVQLNKLLKSIGENGYIGSPIVANENHEICDGQARLDACKTLGVPIQYTIKKGIGIDECIALNAYTTNWGLQDYIDMYAELGHPSYTYLKVLLQEYGKYVKLRTIVFATLGITNATALIKEGRYKCSQSSYEYARNVLRYVKRFTPFLKRAAGRKDYYLCAAAIFFMCPYVDNDVFYKHVEMYQVDLIPVGRIEDALAIFEDIYNRRNKSKVYIVADYKRALDSPDSWFRKRFGGNGK